MKNLARKLGVLAMAGTLMLPFHGKAVDIRNDGEITINGREVSLTDSFYIDSHFQGRWETTDSNGDGIIDVHSWQYTPNKDGNMFVMINKKGLTSRQVFDSGYSEEEYFREFRKFVCLWEDEDSRDYGKCTEIDFNEEDVIWLLEVQRHFEKETRLN